MLGITESNRRPYPKVLTLRFQRLGVYQPPGRRLAGDAPHRVHAVSPAVLGPPGRCRSNGGVVGDAVHDVDVVNAGGRCPCAGSPSGRLAAGLAARQLRCPVRSSWSTVGGTPGRRRRPAGDREAPPRSRPAAHSGCPGRPTRGVHQVLGGGPESVSGRASVSARSATSAAITGRQSPVLADGSALVTPFGPQNLIRYYSGRGPGTPYAAKRISRTSSRRRRNSWSGALHMVLDAHEASKKDSQTCGGSRSSHGGVRDGCASRQKGRYISSGGPTQSCPGNSPLAGHVLCLSVVVARIDLIPRGGV